MIKRICHHLIILIFISVLGVTTQAQTTLNKITKSGVIKVGMSGNQPPFSMEAKDGTLMGFEVDLANVLAESMKLLPALEKGKVDMVMSGMTITLERNMKAAFVGPYVLSGKSILTKMENLAKADEKEDLNIADLKITSLKGSTSEKFVTQYLPEATSLPAEDYNKALSKLLNNEANVMVADFPRFLSI